MKPHKLLLCAPVLALAGVVAAINFGCEKKPSSEPTTPPAPKIVSATKTSFSEVTSQLDPGGNFYLYLGTAQWLEGLSTKVGSWRQSVLSMPDLKADDTVNIGKAFDIVTHLIADSGVEDITGLGLSSVEVENGVFRNKAVMHHYSGKGNGFLWQFCGGQPHALSGLDYLPAETALACFSDMNLPLLWSVVQKEVAQADVPQAQQFLKDFPKYTANRTVWSAACGGMHRPESNMSLVATSFLTLFGSANFRPMQVWSVCGEPTGV